MNIKRKKKKGKEKKMAGKSKLVVDAAPFRTFAVAYAVAAALVVIAIIVGATGPTPTVSSVSYVYDCENNSHVWSPEHCIGTEPDYVPYNIYI